MLWCGVVVVETRGSGEDEGVLAGVKLDAVVVLHFSQLACEVMIMVYNGVGEGYMV